MAQSGFHGLFGLVTGPPLARRLFHRVYMRRTFLLGYVLGNLAPDLDWIPLLMVWFADPQLAPSMHRGFTHSIAGVLLPLLSFGVAARFTRDRQLRALAWGVAYGVMGHIILDVLVWFSGVDLLWPLGHFGFQSYFTLWEWFQMPPLLGQLLAATEYLAYAVYLAYLEHLAREADRGTRYLPLLRNFRRVLGWLTAAFLLLALATDYSTFYLLHGIVWALVAFPTIIYLTVLLGPAIRAQARDPD